MNVEPRGRFENLDYAYNSGYPIIYKVDEEKGLFLGVDWSGFRKGWLTSIKQKSDNNFSKKPKKLPFSNFITLEIIRAGGLSRLSTTITPSVYSRESVIRAAYPKWIHVSQIVKNHYHQKAIRLLAVEAHKQVYSINMLLAPTLANGVINNKGCKYLLKRLSNSLEKRLHRRPVLWLKLEAVKKTKDIVNFHSGEVVAKGQVSRTFGLLHAHGSIVLSDIELEIVKDVVRKLNASNNAKFKNYELRLKAINKNDNPAIDDPKWVEYCNKHRLLNRAFLNGLNSYSRSKCLGSLAEKIYEEDRSELKALV